MRCSAVFGVTLRLLVIHFVVVLYGFVTSATAPVARVCYGGAI